MPNFPPLFSFTNCVLIIPHDPLFAFNINLLFLDLTYVGSMSSVFSFFFHTIKSKKISNDQELIQSDPILLIILNILYIIFHAGLLK